jgi:hypothetical protein
VAYERSRSLCDEVIPAAVDNVDRTVVGYRYGKFSYLDVLESERTLVNAVAGYVDALAEYQSARVDVERLIGQPLHSFSGDPTAEAAWHTAGCISDRAARMPSSPRPGFDPLDTPFGSLTAEPKFAPAPQADEPTETVPAEPQDRFSYFPEPGSVPSTPEDSNE